MEDCIFCKIANNEFNTEFIYEDSKIVAFKDISPVAPEHILVIPREHFVDIEDAANSDILGHLFSKAVEIAKMKGLDEYRLVVNKGEEAGQTVFHLHLHIIAGRKMEWPPG